VGTQAVTVGTAMRGLRASEG